MNRRATLSLPYPEGAAVALVKHLSEMGVLQTAFMPSRVASRTMARMFEKLPSSASKNLSGKLSRGSNVSEYVSEIDPAFELKRIMYRSPIFRKGFSEHLNNLKASFDEKVSTKSDIFSDYIFGMPGASLSTFKAATGSFKVFHEVDSHPEVHNELLLQTYTRSRVATYLHPPAAIARINAELSYSDAVLVPSQFVGTQMQRYGVPFEKIIRVPYGVDLEAFNPALEDSIPLSHRSTKLRLLYAGQIRYGKGVPLLIEAMHHIKNAELVLAGPLVHDGIVDALPDNATYIGTLSRKMLVEHLDQTDAFVYPSLEDNFVLGISEALAMGVPVITTRNVGAAEYMTEADGFVIDAGNLQDLIATLDSLGPLRRDVRLDRAKDFRCRGFNGQQSLSTSWATYAKTVWEDLEKVYKI